VNKIIIGATFTARSSVSDGGARFLHIVCGAPASSWRLCNEPRTGFVRSARGAPGSAGAPARGTKVCARRTHIQAWNARLRVCL